MARLSLCEWLSETKAGAREIRSSVCYITVSARGDEVWIRVKLNSNNVLLAQVRVLYRAQIAIATQASPNGNAMIVMIFETADTPTERQNS